jgi:hypothetical protein
MAQRYGEYQAEDRVVDTDIAVRRRLGRAEIVTTEAEFLAAQAGRRGMRMVVPRTGTGLLSFPLAVRDDAPAYARRAARDLRDWLFSQAGRRALAHAHLRGPGGRALQQGGIGDPGFLPAVVTSDLDAYRLTWQVMSVPSSVLAIFDVSGSMDFPTPHDGRRIDVAVGAAQVALDVFPDHARVGLWVFSINRGGKGQDWRVLDPVRRLDSNLGGITQRASLLRRAREMRTMAKGGTGLYDTALAGYRAALRAYDPNYSNVMILLTDGANDDPRSIGQKALLARLGKLRDPRRPVRIIGIAISKDADLTSLTRIARATGGNAYRADTPTDILKVFASEIANRS